jgi:hypothetical protein
MYLGLILGTSGGSLQPVIDLYGPVAFFLANALKVVGCAVGAYAAGRRVASACLRLGRCPMIESLMRTSILVTALILTSTCGRRPVPEDLFRFDQQIGIANVHGTDGCLAIADPSIAPGAKVILADQGAENLGFKESRIGEGTVVERLSEDCDNRKLYSTELSVSGPAYYLIRQASEWNGNSYAFAIVDPAKQVSINKEGNIEGDLDGDGTTESFRVCTSSEGGHYQVWTGQPLAGKPRWHWYVYAGYDTGVTCTEKEYFGPK